MHTSMFADGDTPPTPRPRARRTDNFAIDHKDMLRTLTLLSAVGIAHAVPHHGAYMDPAHYKGEDSYAGMRYIAEGPPHVLTMIGSDDGATWYTLKGTCSEAGMGTLTFDFSPKGGPKELVGKSTERDDGVWTVVWPDGNAWVSVPSPDKTSSLATPPPPPPKPLW